MMNKTDPLDKKVIGIIGSGQLGKMTAIAAIKLGHKTHIFASTKNDPACFYAILIILEKQSNMFYSLITKL